VQRLRVRQKIYQPVYLSSEPGLPPGLVATGAARKIRRRPSMQEAGGGSGGASDRTRRKPQSLRSILFSELDAASRQGWAELVAQIGEWRRRIRSRDELLTLDDRDLQDIGLTHLDARREASKPFWRE
jgi:uncharacterized protein YjiS (DUF1127 family)